MILVVTAANTETAAIGEVDGATVVTAGIGRTNAAVATTRAILRKGPFDAVLSAGVAGALPGADLTIGDIIVASACVYAEEGLITPAGFLTMDAIGFALGDFEGNVVPVDADLLERLSETNAIGPIATVATCSGTDEAAAMIARRTGAIAEAMEGAAVVHAARTFNLPAIELRAISNTTGDRAAQTWDLAHGLAALGPAVRTAVKRCQEPLPPDGSA